MWLVVPGNHDYHPSHGIEAQLAFSDDKSLNPFGKWSMGSLDAGGTTRVPWGQHRLTTATSDCVVDLFLLDTCATQYSVRRSAPETLERWPTQLLWLRGALKASTATWKVVCGHHPLFTVGRGHQDEARCLRGAQYTSVADPFTLLQGMGLLDALHDGGADAYLCGHEHWFAARSDARRMEDGSCHVVESVLCGNSVESRLWLGRYEPRSYSEFDSRGLKKLETLIPNVLGGEASDGVSGDVLEGLINGTGEVSRRLDTDRCIYSTSTHVDMELPAY